MTVGEACTRDVVTVGRSDSVLDVARIMRDRHVGDVVVLEGEGRGTRPVGILTDRDIVVGIVAQTPDKLGMLRVEDVMTVELVTVSVGDTVDAALDVMRARGVRRVPVVAADGYLAGIVTFDDLVGVIARELNELMGVVASERRRELQTRA